MATVGATPGIALLAEAKAYLRIETDAEDALLSGMLRSAERMVEAWVGQLLVRRELAEDGHARDGVLALAEGPVVQVVSVSRADGTGGFEEVPPGEWTLRLGREGRGRIELRARQDARIRVVYRAGVAEGWNEVPEPLRLAVVRTAAHVFTHRDASDDAGVPPVVRQMLAAWRRLRMI